ncbi:hypothetical protein BDB01DRAFT_781055 [Pilobolus umbonatus]|nr:hypothetical protein BDB01DRAFT_781055 [Pilobolus umbonatus]
MAVVLTIQRWNYSSFLITLCLMVSFLLSQRWQYVYSGIFFLMKSHIYTISRDHNRLNEG